MLKFSDWINRLRHNRGFGVQSPSAFYFVTQVLKEHHPYYAYDEIDKASVKSKQGCKYHRRLFRIANHLRPQSIIIIGKESKAAHTALAAARPSATIKTFESLTAECKQAMAHTQTSPHLLYIGECDNYAQACDTAIKNATDNSAIIVADIHATPQKTAWWNNTIKNTATRVTYDLYSAGLLLFDKEKPKQHYTLKL